MVPTAVVFPGQGAQYAGMGRELVERFPEAAEVLERADRVLGRPLSRVVLDGPEEVLARTENTQPAILAVSVAAWRALLARYPGFRPVAAAGHSLGEYSALVAAGSLSLEEALPLVQERASLIQSAVPLGRGGMAALLGLAPAAVEELCERVTRETGAVVEPSAYNCPGQVVVSGHVEAVERAVELALSELGARAARTLKVSAPFHCSLLEPARRAMEERLARVELRPPAFPVVQNADGREHVEPGAIRENLARQVVEPVRWEQGMRRLLELGARRFVELGPGRVLTGLFKKLDRRIDAFTLDRSGTWDRDFLGGA